MPNGNNVIWVIVGVLLIIVLLMWILGAGPVGR